MSKKKINVELIEDFCHNLVLFFLLASACVTMLDLGLDILSGAALVGALITLGKTIKAARTIQKELRGLSDPS